MTTPDIPLLDIQAWRDGTPGNRERLAARMDQALRDSGFLLIANHGVEAGLRMRIREESRRFFALPHERKARYATPVGGRGWIPQGGEANAFYGEEADPGRADLKESLTIGRDFRTGDEAIDAEWFQPNIFPAERPELSPLCAQFTAQVRELYYDLLRMSATALGLPGDWFTDRVRRGPHTFNINRYRRCALPESRRKASSASRPTRTGASSRSWTGSRATADFRSRGSTAPGRMPLTSRTRSRSTSPTCCPAGRAAGGGPPGTGCCPRRKKRRTRN